MSDYDGSDKLILSLSHAPLPTTLLDALLDRASSECNAVLESIAEYTKKQQQQQEQSNNQTDCDEKKIESMEIEPKEQEQKLINSTVKGNIILHVLATGTPYVIKPGKSQPDYIQQWTKGERILARLVDKIGMEKFHRIPKDGETKLAGRLIDVKPSDFEFVLNHTNNNIEEGDDATGEWKDDCLMEELTWIANNILRMLIIDKRPNIGAAQIIFPLDPRFEHVKEANMLSFIQGIFQKEWSGAEGPLNGAQIEVIVVKDRQN
mmetsp:Transcript_16763/g.21210  ORF Transcript_16763/g.21210 Transcript_16763/m.21210 type:complete len:263 (-) Transcript_16763:164-952(-)|eukprot:CAMPEP_0203662228 /NCGR_PEP_ID=MMETSP0090-20130426/266_1 /ASSEMBLY_ACC=CAM_ASM_001088 /TAXON_ID=426623 /ORGANISM="Chaetoceros affinis, Strain CCMP159" /LENGTH=262 /DNA_ID=CAMNT_0050524987 /DNA_START=29 /DNA_END=817 /DNA_ORIENTATION=+